MSAWPCGLGDGAAVELGGFSSCYWSPLFQVTILVEPFQGHAIFSMNNLDIRDKSGFGLNMGRQIYREIKICFC